MSDPNIPKTNFHPPFNITRASHLVFTARDLVKSREFYTEVMGLIVSDEDADTLWLRGVEERAHHSLTLKKTAGQPECERVGFRVFMDEDLDKAKAHFDKAGIKAAFVETPHQDRTLHFNDPAGTPVELVATMKTVPRMHTKFMRTAAPAHCGWITIRCWCRTCSRPRNSTWTWAFGFPTISMSRRRSAWSARSCIARTTHGTSCC